MNDYEIKKKANELLSKYPDKEALTTDEMLIREIEGLIYQIKQLDAKFWVYQSNGNHFSFENIEELEKAIAEKFQSTNKPKLVTNIFPIR